jgi:hypothetical protein
MNKNPINVFFFHQKEVKFRTKETRIVDIHPGHL